MYNIHSAEVIRVSELSGEVCNGASSVVLALERAVQRHTLLGLLPYITVQETTKWATRLQRRTTIVFLPPKG